MKRSFPSLALAAGLLGLCEWTALRGDAWPWLPLIPAALGMAAVRTTALTWRELHVAQLLAALVCGLHHPVLIPVAIAVGGGGLHLAALVDPVARDRGAVGGVPAFAVAAAAGLGLLVALAVSVAAMPHGSLREIGLGVLVCGGVGGLAISGLGSAGASLGWVRPGTLAGAAGALAFAGAVGFWMATGHGWFP